MKRLLAFAILLTLCTTTASAFPRPSWHKVKQVAVYAGVAGAAVAIALLADRDHHKAPAKIHHPHHDHDRD